MKPTLSIGTVQFGLPYGISNSLGQTTLPDIEAIFRLAADADIFSLDTARAYGSSEINIGSILSAHFKNDARWQITTKTQPVINPSKLEGEFLQSLNNLCTKSIHALLVHNADSLLGSEGALIWKQLQEFKEKGLVRKIGASIYSGSQISSLLGQFPIDILQVPINVFDHRLLRDGTLARAKEKGVEIHARSLFLQGLIFLAPQARNHFFDSEKTTLNLFQEECQKMGIPPMQAALSFAQQITYLDKLVVGVNNPLQFAEIIDASKKPQVKWDWEKFSLQDGKILNPALWPK